MINLIDTLRFAVDRSALTESLIDIQDVATAIFDFKASGTSLTWKYYDITGTVQTASINLAGIRGLGEGGSPTVVGLNTHQVFTFGIAADSTIRTLTAAVVDTFYSYTQTAFTGAGITGTMTPSVVDNKARITMGASGYASFHYLEQIQILSSTAGGRGQDGAFEVMIIQYDKDDNHKREWAKPVFIEDPITTAITMDFEIDAPLFIVEEGDYFILEYKFKSARATDNIRFNFPADNPRLDEGFEIVFFERLSTPGPPGPPGPPGGYTARQIKQFVSDVLNEGEDDSDSDLIWDSNLGDTEEVPAVFGAIKDNAVTTDKIKDGAVTADKINANVNLGGVVVVSALPTTNIKTTKLYFLTQKVASNEPGFYRYINSAWVFVSRLLTNSDLNELLRPPVRTTWPANPQALDAPKAFILREVIPADYNAAPLLTLAFRKYGFFNDAWANEFIERRFDSSLFGNFYVAGSTNKVSKIQIFQIYVSSRNNIEQFRLGIKPPILQNELKFFTNNARIVVTYEPSNTTRSRIFNTGGLPSISHETSGHTPSGLYMFSPGVPFSTIRQSSGSIQYRVNFQSADGDLLYPTTPLRQKGLYYLINGAYTRVDDVPLAAASIAEAEAGVNNEDYMTPATTKAAIIAQESAHYIQAVDTQPTDLSPYPAQSVLRVINPRPGKWLRVLGANANERHGFKVNLVADPNNPQQSSWIVGTELNYGLYFIGSNQYGDIFTEEGAPIARSKSPIMLLNIILEITSVPAGANRQYGMTSTLTLGIRKTALNPQPTALFFRFYSGKPANNNQIDTVEFTRSADNPAHAYRTYIEKTGTTFTTEVEDILGIKYFRGFTANPATNNQIANPLNFHAIKSVIEIDPPLIKATTAEAQVGTIDTKYMTPAKVKSAINQNVPQVFRNDANVAGQLFRPSEFWVGTQTQWNAYTKKTDGVYFIISG